MGIEKLATHNRGKHATNFAISNINTVSLAKLYEVTVKKVENKTAYYKETVVCRTQYFLQKSKFT